MEMKNYTKGPNRKDFLKGDTKKISGNVQSHREFDYRILEFEREIEEIQSSLKYFGPEGEALIRKLENLFNEFEILKNKYQRSKEQLFDAERQNQKLVAALQEAKSQILALREEIDKLCSPPNNYAVFLCANRDGTVDISFEGRRMRVNVHPSINIKNLREGDQVLLNEVFNIIDICNPETNGEVSQIKDIIDENRILVVGRGDEEKVVELSERLKRENIQVGDNVMVSVRAPIALEKIPKSDVEEVVLEEIPDVTYDDIGGLDKQIEELRDAIELPYLYPNEFAEHKLTPPKGILLYGPPGCGKTMIAKAVANSLAKRIEEKTGKKTQSYFLNVKGPELLNKYVGETEFKIREVFKKAKSKAKEDVPVIVFFDEMDSLFRIRGSGISSDVETTIVAQFLSEIDGVEALKNVIVIGASNRQDLIDPAVLRPGRLDLKIKIDRPNMEAAKDIFSKYLKEDLPYTDEDLARFGGDRKVLVKWLIEETVKHMYAATEENQFLEVTYARGDKEIFYFKDFVSGAMIMNIVSRAKKSAIKRFLSGGKKGITLQDLINGVRDEFKENEDLPNTTNPDDWAKISGRKGERIINVRTLISGITTKGKIIEDIVAGQYL